jgi:hypothetical protein
MKFQQTDFLKELFSDEFHKEHKRNLDRKRKEWKDFWGWNGPSVGEYCLIGTTCPKLVEKYLHPEHGAVVDYIYAYTERCRLIEKIQEEKWIAVIEVCDVLEKPWSKNGIQIILEEIDMIPSEYDLHKRN